LPADCRLLVVITERHFGVGAAQTRESAARGTRCCIATAGSRAAAFAGSSSSSSRSTGSAGSARGRARIGGVGTVVRTATEGCKRRTPYGDPKRTSTVQQ
jgi:hypothetical protein